MFCSSINKIPSVSKLLRYKLKKTFRESAVIRKESTLKFFASSSQHPVIEFFFFFFYLFSSTSHVTWMRKISVHFTWSCRIKMSAFDPGTEQRDWGKQRSPQLRHYSQCTGGHDHTQVFRSEGRRRDSNWKNEKIKVVACAYGGGNDNILLDVYLLYSSMCWTSLPTCQARTPKFSDGLIFRAAYLHSKTI